MYIETVEFYNPVCLTLPDDTLTQLLNIWTKCKFDKVIKIHAE